MLLEAPLTRFWSIFDHSMLADIVISILALGLLDLDSADVGHIFEFLLARQVLTTINVYCFGGLLS